jgi:hypothetical protein
MSFKEINQFSIYINNENFNLVYYNPYFRPLFIVFIENYFDPKKTRMPIRVNLKNNKIFDINF